VRARLRRPLTRDDTRRSLRCSHGNGRVLQRITATARVRPLRGRATRRGEGVQAAAAVRVAASGVGGRRWRCGATEECPIHQRGIAFTSWGRGRARVDIVR
jgi:hypothetical protein